MKKLTLLTVTLLGLSTASFAGRTLTGPDGFIIDTYKGMDYNAENCALILEAFATLQETYNSNPTDSLLREITSLKKGVMVCKARGFLGLDD